MGSHTFLGVSGDADPGSKTLICKKPAQCQLGGLANHSSTEELHPLRVREEPEMQGGGSSGEPGATLCRGAARLGTATPATQHRPQRSSIPRHFWVALKQLGRGILMRTRN